jgi:hypothetical protein
MQDMQISRHASDKRDTYLVHHLRILWVTTIRFRHQSWIPGPSWKEEETAGVMIYGSSRLLCLSVIICNRSLLNILYPKKLGSRHSLRGIAWYRRLSDKVHKMIMQATLSVIETTLCDIPSRLHLGTMDSEPSVHKPLSGSLTHQSLHLGLSHTLLFPSLTTGIPLIQSPYLLFYNIPNYPSYKLSNTLQLLWVMAHFLQKLYTLLHPCIPCSTYKLLRYDSSREYTCLARSQQMRLLSRSRGHLSVAGAWRLWY